MNPTLITGLGVPAFIAASGQNLFVSDQSRGLIGEYTTTGATVNASLVTGFNSPQGIAVSGNDLFVVDQRPASVAQIGEYNAVTGATINASLVPDLVGPVGLAVSGGNLFVTQNDGVVNGGEVTEYDATTGEIMNSFLISGLNEPYGIAISGTNLFVTNPGSRTVGEYTTSGATINASLIMQPPLLGGPLDIAASSNQLFVVAGSTIGEFTTTGETINPALITGLESFSVLGVAVVVPEPASAWLMGSASLVIGAILLRRRQTRHALGADQ